MSLLLTGTQDHALLALVIQEAREAADSNKGYVGRTAVQKIMYFLQALQVPMNYRFDIYQYGPFCDAILRDTEWLMADGVVKDRSTNTGKFSDYATTEVIEELVGPYRECLKPYQEVVHTMVQALVPLEPTQLELIATLDYLYRKEKASGRTHAWKETIIARFKEVKGDKFSDGKVAQAYDVLADVGLVER